ncbi:hypothetical protein D8S78_23195 [Natrialba swarupiae]|nr:hypothetical protein [Natrialba swarupiae]
MTHDADADLEFLEEHLDFAVSDKIVGESGFTIQAWLRHGRFHHDVGLSNGNDVVRTLHHLAFQMDSFDHMKKFCDRLASKGHRLELGPSRHNAGGNLFAYFWAPGGNRIELTAEMATVDPDAETGIREIDRETNTVSTWGGVVPTKEFLGGIVDGLARRKNRAHHWRWFRHRSGRRGPLRRRGRDSRSTRTRRRPSHRVERGVRRHSPRRPGRRLRVGRQRACRRGDGLGVRQVRYLRRQRRHLR